MEKFAEAKEKVKAMGHLVAPPWTRNQKELQSGWNPYTNEGG